QLFGGVQQIEEFFLLLVLGEGADIDGALGHVRRPLLGEADEGVDLAIPDPYQGNAAERAAIAIELAALDGEPLLRAAGEAQDLLDRRVDPLRGRRPVDVVVGGLAGRADDELLAPHQLVPALDAGGPKSVADPKLGADDADPRDLAKVEIDPF